MRVYWRIIRAVRDGRVAGWSHGSTRTFYSERYRFDITGTSLSVELVDLDHDGKPSVHIKGEGIHECVSHNGRRLRRALAAQGYPTPFEAPLDELRNL